MLRMRKIDEDIGDYNEVEDTITMKVRGRDKKKEI